MQPITQARVDLECNDIRLLRADQEFYGVMGCFGLSSLRLSRLGLAHCSKNQLFPILMNHLNLRCRKVVA